MLYNKGNKNSRIYRIIGFFSVGLSFGSLRFGSLRFRTLRFWGAALLGRFAFRALRF